MKRLFAITLAAVFASITINAQNWSEGSSAGTISFNSEVNYEQMFLESTDDLKSSWAISPSIGLDYFLIDNIYLGTGLGLSDGTIKYDFGRYGTSTTSIYDIRVPVKAGISLFGANIKMETGPFINFTVGGSTSYYYDRETTTTKFKDMDMDKTALGWSINLKLFGLVNVGYSFMLTDSPYGESGDYGFLSVGLAYSLPF